MMVLLISKSAVCTTASQPIYQSAAAEIKRDCVITIYFSPR